LCFAGHDTDVPVWEDAIRHISASIFSVCNK
jgi:hypothetical protein